MKNMQMDTTQKEVAGLQLIWVLFLMSRPSQLVLIGFVYLVGGLIAWSSGTSFDAQLFWFGLLVLIPVSMSIHYANEYADVGTDSLTTRSPFSGGSGALPTSGADPKLALAAAWIALGLSSVLAIMGWVGSLLSLAAVGVLGFGAFFGWSYSLKPLALGWRGWGELDNAVLGGIALPLYGFVVQAGRIEGWVILSCIPFGAAVFINLLATTWPDREADAAVGKRTLATRWTPARLRLSYWLAVLGMFVSIMLLYGRILPPVVVWSSLITVPLLLWGGLVYTRQHSAFPTVAAMVVMLFVQILAWWSETDFCCLSLSVQSIFGG